MSSFQHRDDTYGWDVLDLSGAIRSCDGIWQIRQAHDINDDGWIAAWGLDSEQTAWAVVLIPVPVGLGDSNGDFVVNQADLDDVIAFWDQETDPPGCFWKRGDLTGDGMVRLPDLLAVISNWGTIYDPCGFTPDVCGAAAFAGGGFNGLFSGPPETPFGGVLEEWGFEDWDEAEHWLESASVPDVMMFMLALTQAAED